MKIIARTRIWAVIPESLKATLKWSGHQDALRLSIGNQEILTTEVIIAQV
jgi:hypothetical protein